jgi:hypothetical protein
MSCPKCGSDAVEWDDGVGWQVLIDIDIDSGGEHNSYARVDAYGRSFTHCPFCGHRLPEISEDGLAFGDLPYQLRVVSCEREPGTHSWKLVVDAYPQLHDAVRDDDGARIAAAIEALNLDAPQLTWTREMPTVAGIYWVKFPDRKLIQLFAIRQTHIDSNTYHLAERFYGPLPIQKPEPPPEST